LGTDLGNPNLGAFPGFSQLYEIGTASETCFRGALDSGNHRKLTRGEESPTRQLILRYEMGNPTPGMAVFALGPYVIILHQTAIALLEERALTGWRTYPVLVRDKAGVEHVDYAGLAFIGRCGQLSNRESPEFVRESLRGNHKSTWRRGMYFDSSTWDGSDFFMPKVEQDFRLCTSRAVAALKDAGVTELELTPMDQSELMFQF
jgi:hypothetical protein